MSTRFWPLLVLMTLGCEPGEVPSAPATSAWTVDATAVFTVGLLEGPSEYLFSNISSVHLTENGGVTVADWGSLSIRLYDLDGRFLRRLGSEGPGPGEFQRLGSTWITGDTLITGYDLGRPGFNAFSVDGSLVRSVTLKDVVGHPGHVIGTFSDGNAVLGQLNYGERGPGLVADIVAYDEYSPSGQRERRILDERGALRYDSESRWPRGGLPHPFSGSPSAVVFADSIFYSTGFDEIRVWSREGNHTRTIHLPESNPSASTAWEDFVAAMEAAESEADLSGVPRLSQVPQGHRLLIDAEGLLWVQQFEPTAHPIWLGSARAPDGGTWWVLDRNGTIEAEVVVPSGLFVHEVGTERLVGTTRDELGVERVAVHRLSRGASN